MHETFFDLPLLLSCVLLGKKEAEMGIWLWVMLGGGFGAAGRFGLSTIVQAKVQDGFPAGTLTVNLIGCLAIGFAAVCLEPLAENRPALHMGLVVGFLGGFTTFSSFGLETVKLLQLGQYTSATTYVLASNVVGLCFVGCGMWMARIFQVPG